MFEAFRSLPLTNRNFTFIAAYFSSAEHYPLVCRFIQCFISKANVWLYEGYSS